MKKLAIIGTVIPEPNSTAAGTRMLQLITIFKQQGFDITFLSAANASENSFKLDSLAVVMQKIQVNDEGFSEIIKAIAPDIVMFDRFNTEEQFGWKVSEACPEVVKILDTEDLHFLREARRKAFSEKRVVNNSDYINDIFKREMASILRCDLSLIISEFEFKLLTETFRIDEKILHYIPMFAEDKNSQNSFFERKNFLSIGNFLHEPNWQTVLQLKALWPKIKQRLPNAELHIYGAYVTEKAKQLHNTKDGFLIKGRAEENVQQLFENYRVLLAPIPFGAGIKGKLLDSMQFGLPNVTTAIGAEAMHGELPWNGFITDLEHFANKSVELYKNEALWLKSQENGREIIKQRFSAIDFEKALIQKIQLIQENLQEHRNQNFLGQILQHHNLQSTKYLGKWIEEKNKKN